MNKLCSMPGCDDLPRANQRYCPECHSKYMKTWRAKRKRQQEKLMQSVLSMRKTIVGLKQENAELKVG